MPKGRLAEAFGHTVTKIRDDAGHVRITVHVDRIVPFRFAPAEQNLVVHVSPAGSVSGYEWGDGRTVGPVIFGTTFEQPRIVPHRRASSGGGHGLYAFSRFLWKLRDAYVHAQAAFEAPAEGEPFLVSKILDGRGEFFDNDAALASLIHNAVWEQLEPELRPEALRPVVAVGGSSALYNEIAPHPHFLQLIAQCPLIGYVAAGVSHEFPDAVQLIRRITLLRGTNLETALRRTLNAAFAIYNDADCHSWETEQFDGPQRHSVRRFSMVSALTPGFVTWARALSWDGAQLASVRERETNYPQWLAVVQGMLQTQHWLDPNRMRRITDPHELELLHHAALQGRRFRMPWLAATVARNSASALRAVQDNTPRRGEPLDQAVRVLLGDIRDAVQALGIPDDLHEYSFARLCRLNQEYHERLEQQRLEEVAAEARRNMVRFPPPRHQAYEDERFILKWLPDSVALAEEGAKMGHCVSTYSDMCRRGRTLIYGVRSKKGDSVATLEVGPDYSVRQLRGPKNHPVSRDVEEFVDEALESFELARQGITPRAHPQNLMERIRAANEALDVAAGYDPMPDLEGYYDVGEDGPEDDYPNVEDLPF